MIIWRLISTKKAEVRNKPYCSKAYINKKAELVIKRDCDNIDASTTEKAEVKIKLDYDETYFNDKSEVRTKPDCDILESCMFSNKRTYSNKRPLPWFGNKINVHGTLQYI